MAWSIFTDGGGSQVAVGWAHQLLQMLGAPDTPGNVEFIYQWEKAEGGGGKYNPLNQGPVAGKPYLTTTGSQYGGGAADFASWNAGLQGAVDYLHYSQYKGVLDGLMNNNPTAARSALWSSPWAASHYGYGSNWPFIPVPGGTPVLPGNATTGVGTTAAGITTVATKPDTCAWGFSTPVSGFTCVLSNVAGRGMIAGMIGATGVLLGIVGVVLMVVITFEREINAGGVTVNRGGVHL